MRYGNLKEGDIVVASNALFGLREYPVKKILGNKAITDFRTFNRRIYPGGNVYEFGKRFHPEDNWYWVKKGEYPA